MFLSEDIGTAVDERRHSQVTHLAKATSIRDFREQVEAKCPEGTPIPSDEWLRLQFWPKTPKARTALHYTGQLKVWYMVQARQFRKTDVDEHYTAAFSDTYGSLLFASGAVVNWFAWTISTE